jgi:hypothetical protein
VACFATAPAVATQDGLVKREATRLVQPGGYGQVSVEVARPARCTLSAPGAWGKVTAYRPGVLRFTFAVRRQARPGRYVVSVACGRWRPARFGIVVAGSGRRGVHKLLAPTGTLVVDGTSAPVPAASVPQPASQTGAPAAVLASGSVTWARALHEAQLRFDRERGELESMFRNGECTDWAEAKRPDLFERVEVFDFAKVLVGAPRPAREWTAHAWDDNARSIGLPVSSTPTAGAIAVFERGMQGAGRAFGHVAYVEEVYANGLVRISEMNAAGGRGVATQRILAPGGLAGISFIPRT